MINMSEFEVTLTNTPALKVIDGKRSITLHVDGSFLPFFRLNSTTPREDGIRGFPEIYMHTEAAFNDLWVALVQIAENNVSRHAQMIVEIEKKKVEQ